MTAGSFSPFLRRGLRLVVFDSSLGLRRAWGAGSYRSGRVFLRGLRAYRLLLELSLHIARKALPALSSTDSCGGDAGGRGSRIELSDLHRRFRLVDSTGR
jgi:hypothetical protein